LIRSKSVVLYLTNGEIAFLVEEEICSLMIVCVGTLDHMRTQDPTQNSVAQTNKKLSLQMLSATSQEMKVT